ncbi:MAG: ADP-ribosyltransferase [Actinomycetota bacterium]
MGEAVSVDLDDLRAFVDRGATVAQSIGRHGGVLSAPPTGAVVAAAQVPAGLGSQLQALLVALTETDRFVADVAHAVQQIDLGYGPGIVASFPRLVDAAVAARAADRGELSIPEQAQRARAFALGRAETASLLAAHFPGVAGRSGAADQLTVDDLHSAAADPTLPAAVRDAAYRLAADATLRADLDVAIRSDLGGGSPGGFDRHHADGVVALADLEEFARLDHQARVLAVWGPLLDTADRGYDLSTADSLIGPGAVEAFVNDPDIPVHARLVVFDTYAEEFDLSLDIRESLEGEYAFVDGAHPRTALDARSTGAPGSAWVPVGPPSGMRAPAGRAPTGPAGGAGPAIVAGLFVEAVTFGWDRGSRLKATVNGDPAVVHLDPRTGEATRYELDALSELTPSQRKAWVAHLEAHGTPPAGTVEAARPPNPDWAATPVLLPPPGTHADPNGTIVYDDDGSFYDGYELSPSQRDSEPLSADELHAIEEYTGGLYYAVNQALRGRIPPSVGTAHITLHLELALDKMPPWTDGPVFRGSPNLPSVPESQLAPGVILEDGAFWSTTRDENRPFEGRYQYTIQSSTSGRMIEHLSTHAHEAEVLFPPGTMFEVQSVEHVDDQVHIVLNEYEEET